jgi:hypothetical protein
MGQNASVPDMSIEIDDTCTENFIEGADPVATSYSNSVAANNGSSVKILQDESDYFMSKYGTTIYNKLLDIRHEYIAPPAKGKDFDLEGYFKSLENISALNQVETIDKPIMDVLDAYLPEYDANTLYREIEYRDAEYIKLSYINYYLNILYYCAFVVLMLLLFSSGNLFLQDRFLIYIFLGLLPILYPWVFMLFRRLFNYIYPSLRYNGPVNAFVDTNTNITTMFSNNASNSFKKNEPTTTVYNLS